MCAARNFTTLFTLFEYNDLQFHLMGHHMKHSIDYMKKHINSKYREAIKICWMHVYAEVRDAAAAPFDGGMLGLFQRISG